MVVHGNFVVEVRYLADVVESRPLSFSVGFFVKKTSIFLLVFLAISYQTMNGDETLFRFSLKCGLWKLKFFYPQINKC